MDGVGMDEMRNAYKILVGNLKGRDHWEDQGVDGNIILEWILIEQGTVHQLWFSLRAENFLTGWVTISFSRRTLLHGVGRLDASSLFQSGIVYVSRVGGRATDGNFLWFIPDWVRMVIG